MDTRKRMKQAHMHSVASTRTLMRSLIHCIRGNAQQVALDAFSVSLSYMNILLYLILQCYCYDGGNDDPEATFEFESQKVIENRFNGSGRLYKTIISLLCGAELGYLGELRLAEMAGSRRWLAR